MCTNAIPYFQIRFQVRNHQCIQIQTFIQYILGWSDDIGGVFQLLDGRWYNSSRKYIRGHLTYEAPFLLLCNTPLSPRSQSTEMEGYLE